MTHKCIHIMGTSNSKNTENRGPDDNNLNNPDYTVLPCKYYGWVCQTYDEIGNRYAGTYEKLIEDAKSVGIMQMRKKKKESAYCIISPHDGMWVSKDGRREDALLSLNMRSLICAVTSRKTGAGVVVAHCQNCVGFDVMQFKQLHRIQFSQMLLHAINHYKDKLLQDQQAQIRSLNAQLTTRSAIPPPYHPTDPINQADHADPDHTDDGYLVVQPPECPVDIDRDNLVPLCEFCEHTMPDTGYMEIGSDSVIDV